MIDWPLVFVTILLIVAAAIGYRYSIKEGDRNEENDTLKALIGDLRSSLAEATRQTPTQKTHIKLPIQYSLITPTRWRSSSDRVRWMREQLASGYFLDVLSILQSTAINPPADGFDPAFEFGRVQGMQLAIRTILSLSQPEEEATKQPPADYGAAETLQNSSLNLTEKEAEAALSGEWTPVEPENPDPLT